MKQRPGKRERRYINIGGRPADLPFSDGVLVGDTVFLSGRIGSILALCRRQRMSEKRFA